MIVGGLAALFAPRACLFIRCDVAVWIPAVLKLRPLTRFPIICKRRCQIRPTTISFIPPSIQRCPHAHHFFRPEAFPLSSPGASLIILPPCICPILAASNFCKRSFISSFGIAGESENSGSGGDW
ncbi:hypothetical protein BDR22DRAFT_702654 [Usnea florida]